MHSSKVGWAGQAFALATSSDTGGRKSRIRRSKEERKSMIESFIQKYQKSNGGNFPSLNLTHKEVGGSFYTVREIVREIIQENLVLAPPKVSSEEHSLSGFLEQHPLGSISMEPFIDLSVSDGVDVVMHIVPNKIQFSSAENISTSDKPLITSADHYDDIDKRLGSQILSNEHQTVDKAKEFGQRILAKPTAMETLHREKLEAQNIETSPAIKSHTNSDIVVETFPLRPVPRTVNNMSEAEESGKLKEAANMLEDKGIEHDKKTFTQSSSSFVSEKGDQKLPHSTVELNVENWNEKVVLNLQVPSMENAKHPSASKPSVLNAGDIPELETKVSLPNRAKVSSSTETLISEDSQENSNVAKGNNPTLDRINLETWEGASKKSTQPESNPLLALVKAMISSFMKFWTE